MIFCRERPVDEKRTLAARDYPTHLLKELFGEYGLKFGPKGELRQGEK